MSLTRKKGSIVFDYTIFEEQVLRVVYVRDLGVFVDSTLDFRLHVSHIVGQGLRQLSVISRLTKKISSL